MKLFGSSGIRGLVNEDIDLKLTIKVGETIGSIYDSVVIGYDPRTSNQMLAHALISGLLSTGCDVFNAGMVSTPTLAYATRDFGCGIMITASHNPPEYNGLKFWNPDGSGFNTEQMEQVENFFEKEPNKADFTDINNSRIYPDAIEEHIQKIIGDFNEMNLKVVVDCGCGAASTITPYLFQRLGCKVISLNSQPDGFFPGRNSEPSLENLSALIETVKSTQADLGIAHDGDADRMVAVDEKGNYVGGDELLPIFAKSIVKKSVVVPVNASMAVDDVVGDAKVIRTKVGDVFISEEVKKNKADFGGEPSGTWIFPEHSYCPDGIYAAAKLASLVSEKPLSIQTSNMPKYHLLRGALSYDREKKNEILKTVKEGLETLEYQEINQQDGFWLQFQEKWALVRPSGTEPKIRITCEAKDSKEVKELYDKIYNIIKGCTGQ
jgi:phosphoglucosamine mutase